MVCQRVLVENCFEEEIWDELVWNSLSSWCFFSNVCLDSAQRLLVALATEGRRFFLAKELLL